MTSIEREEKEKVKKKEKKQEEEETMQQATWVKYTFPVRHQVTVTGLHQGALGILNAVTVLLCRDHELLGCCEHVCAWLSQNLRPIG